MGNLWAVVFRTLLVVAIFWGLVYVIPWFVLTPVGLIAGYFLYKTTDDRSMALGLMLGSAIFAVSYWIMEQYF